MKNISIISENTLQGVRLTAYNWRTGVTLATQHYIGYSKSEANRLFRNYVRQFV